MGENRAMTTTSVGAIAMITPDPGADAQRRRGLRRMRTLAVSLLAFAAVVYLATLGRHGFWGFVNAGAEASMVGAIADWFAVTALFKHPLGLPVPHTALIPKRKDELGRSLEEFVGENFLQESVIRERIASADISLRVGQWLAEPAHVRRVVDEVAEVASIGLGKVRDDHIADFVTDALIPRFREEPLAPLAGSLLAEVVRDGVHSSLVDLTVDELRRWLVEHPDTFAEVLEQRAPWWAPPRLNVAVTRRLHTEALVWLEEIRQDPHHQARQAFDSLLTQLAHDLQHDPDTQERTERLKVRLLEHPQVVESSVALWNALRRALQSSLVDPDGAVRERLCTELAALGGPRRVGVGPVCYTNKTRPT
jgi:uncharacterized membrane-anchored protein YjiN (DUF445 family)